MPWIRQDPQAKKDYGFTWSLEPGETITVSSWTASPELTLSAQGKSDAATWVTVAGGAQGDRPWATNHVVTSLGREEDKTLHFMIENT